MTTRFAWLLASLTFLILFAPLGAVMAQESPEATFVQEVDTLTGTFDTSLEAFQSYRVRVNENPAGPELVMLQAAMEEEAATWPTYPDAVADIEVPQACESASDSLTAWGADVEELGNTWEPIARAATQRRWQAFDDQVDVVAASRATLDSLLADCRELTGDLAPTPDAIASPSAEGTDWGTAGSGIRTTRSGTGGELIDIEGDTYVLPTSGAEVVVGTDLTVVSSATDDPDQVAIEVGDGIGIVTATEGPASANGVLALFSGQFADRLGPMQELEFAGDNKIAYGSWTVTQSGRDLILYVHVDAESVPGFLVVQVVLTSAETFATAVELLQGSVTINGRPMLGNVDGEAIVEIYEATKP